MLILIKSLSYLSFLLNIFYISCWVYVYTKLETHQERVESFGAFSSYLGISTLTLSIVLIGLTIFSIIFVLRGNATDRKVMGIIQLVFLALLIWQYF